MIMIDMKKSYIATLTIAACAMLAAAPVSAQSAAPQRTPLSAEEAAYEMEDYISKTKELVAMLEGITDKETADAAAPEVEILRKELRWIVAYVRHHDTDAELLELMSDKYPEAIELEHQMRQIDLRLAKQKWYGSSALRSCYEEGKADDSDVIVADSPAHAKPAPAPKPAEQPSGEKQP